jgi:hypothetical protein
MRDLSVGDTWAINQSLGVVYAGGCNWRPSGFYSAHLSGPMGVNVRTPNTGIWNDEEINRRFTGEKLEKFREVQAYISVTHPELRFGDRIFKHASDFVELLGGVYQRRNVQGHLRFYDRQAVEVEKLS